MSRRRHIAYIALGAATLMCFVGGCRSPGPSADSSPRTVSADTTVTVPPPPPVRTVPPIVLNVKDFGATGDWRTDDTQAIQRALDAVPPEGATVFFPAGGYSVPNGGLISRRTVTLLGVRGLDGSGSRIQVSADDVVGVELDGGGSVLDSMEVTKPETSASSASVGVLMSSDFAQMYSSRISGFGVNLRIAGTYYSVSYSSFRDFYHAGVEINNTVASGDAGDGTITASTFERNTETPLGGSGVHWIAGGGLRFINNKINGEKSLENGIFFEPGAGVDTSVLLVNGNSIENFVGAGVLMLPGVGHLRNSLIVSDNEIASYDEAIRRSQGIAIDEDVSSVAINGNSIYSTGSGITLQSVKGATVAGNSLTKIFNDGIVVGDRAEHVVLGEQSIEVIGGREIVYSP